jgi:hypothetical protein
MGFEDFDFYLVKVDSTGQLVWERRLGTSSFDERMHFLAPADDGGYLMAGISALDTHESIDVYVVKADSAGALLWDKVLGEPGDSDLVYSIDSTWDSGLIIAKRSELIRLDAIAEVTLRIPIESTYVRTSRDGGYIITPIQGGGLSKLDSRGRLEWTADETIGGIGCETSDGGFIKAFATGSTDGSLDIALAKLQFSQPVAKFHRGDSTSDSAVNLSDAVLTLQHLFQSGPAPACAKSADADDSGKLDITDAVYLLQHLFQGGAPPPAPYPECGVARPPTT